MLLVTKHAHTEDVRIYRCTSEQYAAFEKREEEDPSLMSWLVETPDQLEKTALTARELVTLHNESILKGGTQLASGTAKSAAAEALFPLLDRVALPFGFTFTRGAPTDRETPMPRQKSAAPESPKPEAKTTLIKTARVKYALHSTGGEKPAKARIVATRANTRKADLIDMLARPEGATIAQLKTICPNWQDSSIRSGLDYDINSQAGYGLRSEMIEGVLTYFLTYPQGITKPVPHTVPKDKVA